MARCSALDAGVRHEALLTGARWRGLWVIAHRWAGLTIAVFLTIAGLTGTLLVFRDELDARLAPALHLVDPPDTAAQMLDPMTLRARILAAHPGAVLNYLPFQRQHGRTVTISLERFDEAGDLAPWSSEWDEVFIDPYTGAVVGHRQTSALSGGMASVMPFVYRLHTQLALGERGTFLLGVAAVIWSIDCLVGLYLTFPIRLSVKRERPVLQWFARWAPSWLIRRHRSGYRRTLDLHRAPGLWLWPLLLVFATSSIAFNLPQVYDPVAGLFGYERIADGLVPPASARHEPKLSFPVAARVGERLAADAARRYGLTIEARGESGLYHVPAAGLYSYIFTSSADFRREGGRSLILFDSDTGRLIKVVLPQGRNAMFTVTEWITGLHMASVGGLPYRILVSLLGLVVAGLSVTGVLIWVRKRSHGSRIA